MPVQLLGTNNVEGSLELYLVRVSSSSNATYRYAFGINYTIQCLEPRFIFFMIYEQKASIQKCLTGDQLPRRKHNSKMWGSDPIPK